MRGKHQHVLNSRSCIDRRTAARAKRASSFWARRFLELSTRNDSTKHLHNKPSDRVLFLYPRLSLDLLSPLDRYTGQTILHHATTCLTSSTFLRCVSYCTDRPDSDSGEDIRRREGSGAKERGRLHSSTHMASNYPSEMTWS